MRNIELKVKLSDYENLSKRIKVNSSYKGTLFQRDSYYLITNSRLKIREESSKTELIYYKRENTKESKDSKYFIFKINQNAAPLIKRILHIFLKLKKVVEKKRELYIYKNTRIHLDKVKGLGEFLELETVVKDNRIYDKYQKEHNEIISSFGLNTYPQIVYSYSDLN